MRVCLKHLHGEVYEVIDCETGTPIALDVKNKRAPNAYNVFIGQCVRSKTGPVTERFRACVAEWKTKKGG